MDSIMCDAPLSKDFSPSLHVSANVTPPENLPILMMITKTSEMNS